MPRASPQVGSDMTIRVLAFMIEFLPVIIEGDPQCPEHDALTWEEEAALLSYDLAPSDRRYVEARLERRGDSRPDSQPES